MAVAKTLRAILIGSPADPLHQPSAIELLAKLSEIEAQAALSGPIYFEDTLANLNAVSAPAVGSTGFVLDDGVNDGVYRRGESAWAKTSELPGAFSDASSAIAIADALDARLDLVEANDWVTTARIAAAAVTNAKLATVATATIKGRATAGTGAPEDLTAAQARTLLNVADGATANASDADLRDRTTHTGAQAIATVTGLQDALNGKATAAQGALADSAVQPAGLAGAIETEVTNRNNAIEDAVTAEANARIAADGVLTTAISDEVTARAAAVTALEQSIEALGGDSPRPGTRPGTFGVGSIGAAADLPDLLDTAGVAVETVAGLGQVLTIENADVTVAPRAGYAVHPDRIYRLHAVVQRLNDPVDPSGDTVQVGLRRLDAGLADLGFTLVENRALDVVDGIWRATATFQIAPVLAGVDRSLPADTVYVRPFVRTFGTDHETAVAEIDILDVTEAAEIDGVLGALAQAEAAADRAEDAADAAEASADAAATDADAAAASAGAAADYADEAALASIAAGAPIVTALTSPTPANGTVELLLVDGVLQVWQVQAGVWTEVGTLLDVRGTTRDRLVDVVADGWEPPNDTAVQAGALAYLRNSTASVIADLPGWVHATTAPLLFLFLGQSNMRSNPDSTGGDMTVSPIVAFWNGTSTSAGTAWSVPAVGQYPLDRTPDSGVTYANNLGYRIAQRAALKTGRPVYGVMAAQSAHPAVAWVTAAGRTANGWTLPGDKIDVAATMYDSIAAAMAALPYDKAQFDAVFISQGEQESIDGGDYATWAAQWNVIIGELADAGWINADETQIIFSEMVHSAPRLPYISRQRAAIQTLARQNAGNVSMSRSDRVPFVDAFHPTGEGLVSQAERMLGQYLGHMEPEDDRTFQVYDCDDVATGLPSGVYLYNTSAAIPSVNGPPDVATGILYHTQRAVNAGWYQMMLVELPSPMRRTQWIRVRQSGSWTDWRLQQYAASGNTVSRPTFAQPGFCYFDTSVGKPIWFSGSGWVDAAGTAV